jgi:serine protease Do
MSAKLFKPFLWVGILILVVGMACNLTGSGSQEPVATEAPDQPEETEAVTEATEAPATEALETEEPDSLAVSSLEGVQNAVIQIEAQGTFVNPDFTVSFNSAGLGSGFIIDPSGLAVTNNHVVTGAALFKVWIGGDRNTTYNARVLGVSECSDLAVIDIEGDGFPYLEWHEGPINVGLEVYAAGYPLGEPQFTLTKGIVSKEKAGGETSWASVDYVIEHDATINPGNSGGPLVDEDGRVVGVNYSGRQTNQYFAIGRDLAVRTIDTLKGGKDMETFGINGEAFAGDSFSGIWVYSVKSGSPADKAGLTGGDIVTTLEDLILSSDGTMADYCDILRSHSSDATLDIEVLRYFTQEILVGQINGRELETAYNFAETVEEQGDVQVDDTGGYSGYTMVTDDYGSIQMEIPNEWVDTNGGYWIDGEDTIGAAISAAADLDSYNSTWDESGVFFGASDDLAKLGGYVNLLDVRRDAFIDSCKLDGRYDYEDAIYRGKYDLFTNCGDSGNAYIVLTAVPNDNSQAFLILVEIQITNEADFDALDRILATFEVIGILP